MIDARLRARLGHWLLLVALAGLVWFLRLVPTGAGSAGIAWPDWLVLFAFAWVLRRPDYIPVALFAALLFLQDILFLEPPGLWSMIAVLGLEFLRGRAPYSRDLPFLFEWILVGGVLAAMLLGQRILLGLFLLPAPPLASVLAQGALSLLVYPAAVLASTTLFGVRRAGSGAGGLEAGA